MKLFRIISIPLIFIIVCGLLFYSTYIEVKNRAIEQLNKQQMLIAETAAKGIELFFAHYIEFLTYLSKTPQVILINEQGKQLLQTFYMTHKIGIKGITRMDNTGRIVYTFPDAPGAIGSDLTSQEHIQTMLQTHQPVVSDVFDSVQGFMSIALHVPVFDGEVFQGSLAILIPFDELSRDHLESIKIGKDGYGWIISQKGIELFCPVPGHIGHSVFENCKDFPEIIAMAQEMVKGNRGISSYYFNRIRSNDVEEVKKQAVYVPVKLGSTFWSIVIATPEDEALNHIQGFKNRWFLIIGLLLFTVVSSTYYVLNSFKIVQEEKRRKQVLGILKESEEKFSLAFHNSPCAIIITRLYDGKVIDVNLAFSKITGFTKEEVIDRSSLELNLWYNPEERKEIVKDLIEGQSLSGKEYWFRGKDGTVIVGWFSADMIELSGEKCILSTINDITYRKRVEEDLRESELKYRVLIETTDTGFVIVNSDGNVLDANQGYARLTGHNHKNEIIGRNVVEWTALHHKEVNAEAVKKCFNDGKICSLEIDYVDGQGAVTPIEINASVVDIKGIPQIMTLCRDITDRRKNEESLIKSEAMHRHISDLIADYAFSCVKKQGCQYSIDWLVGALEKITGYSVQEVIEKGCWSFFVHPSDLPIFERYVIGLDVGNKQDFELRIVHKDGSIRWLRVFSSSAQDLYDVSCQRIFGSCEDITERKRAEETLLYSENKFKSFSEQALVGVYLIEDEIFKYVNPKFAEMFGYTISECLDNMSYRSLVYHEDLELVVQNLMRRINGDGASILYGFRGLKKDGQVFYVEVYSSVTRYGEKVSAIGTILDVTSRVQKEEENKLLNRLYTVLGNVSHSVISAKDRRAFLEEACYIIVTDGGFILAWIGRIDKDTKQVIPVTAYGPACEYVDNIEVYADDRATGRGPTGTCIREGKPSVHNDFQHLPSTQPWREAAIPFGIQAAAGFPIQVEGHVWGALTIYSDKIGFFSDKDVKLLEKVAVNIGFAIDNFEREKKRTTAEDNLRDSEAKFHSVFDAMAEVVVLHEMIFDDEETPVDYRILDCNPAFTEITGLSCQEVTGKLASGAYGASEPPYLDNYASVVRTGRPVHFETYFESMQRYFAISAVLFQANRFATVSTDITERKAFEEERRKLQERLLRSEKMEALGTLAGGVAHDLNNELGLVVGYSELLLKSLPALSELRSDAEEIFKGGNNAAAIVQDLLTLARRGVANKRVLNLNKIVTDFLKSNALKKLLSTGLPIKVESVLELSLLNMTGSSVHIEKSLANLVVNAVEAMPLGGTITVTTANSYIDRPTDSYDELATGEYVVLSVRDTGEGITSNDLKSIFEPFYTKKMMGQSGTGLGLAVVWGTVKDHFGYINVESEKDVGTIFTIYFPVTREDIDEEVASIDVKEFVGHGESILVVDDVREQRQLANSMLRRLDYNVEMAPSGETAVEYIRDHYVDIVVLDMIMEPGIDGLDTYKRMLEINPHQKAIIVSGFSETERVLEAQKLGAGSYVKKPYILERLGMAVKAELSRKS